MLEVPVIPGNHGFGGGGGRSRTNNSIDVSPSGELGRKGRGVIKLEPIDVVSHGWSKLNSR